MANRKNLMISEFCERPIFYFPLTSQLPLFLKMTFSKIHQIFFIMNMNQDE